MSESSSSTVSHPDMLGERVGDSDDDCGAGLIGVEGGDDASVTDADADGAAGTGVSEAEVEGDGVSQEDVEGNGVTEGDRGLTFVVDDLETLVAEEVMVGRAGGWREVGVLGIMLSDGHATFMCLVIPASSALMVLRSREMLERSVAAVGTGGIRDKSTATNVGMLVSGRFMKSLTMSSKFALFLFCPILFINLKLVSLHFVFT